jgi:hypothetical protein
VVVEEVEEDHLWYQPVALLLQEFSPALAQ